VNVFPLREGGATVEVHLPRSFGSIKNRSRLRNNLKTTQGASSSVLAAGETERAPQAIGVRSDTIGSRADLFVCRLFGRFCASRNGRNRRHGRLRAPPCEEGVMPESGTSGITNGTTGVHRRRLLIAAGAVGATSLAVGAVRALGRDDENGRAEYEEAVRATWRHSASMELDWPDVQREVVRYGTLAANNHNSQPWRFQRLDHGIVVLPHFSPRGPVADFDGHELFVSLGCAVENMVLAAGAFGLRATPRFDPDSGAIEIALDPAARQATALFDAIPHRQTTPVAYEDRPVPVEQMRLLDAAGNGDGVRMMLLTAPGELDEIVRLVGAAFCAPSYQGSAEPLMFRRETYRDMLATRDGWFAKSYILPGMSNAMRVILFRLGLGEQGLIQAITRAMRHSAGMAVFLASRNDPEHWVETGRCCQRFALQATALGIRTAFANEPITVPSVRAELAAFLRAGTLQPDAVIRFGYGPEMPRSLRRAVEQVLVAA
jgi:hypothetical protein